MRKINTLPRPIDEIASFITLPRIQKLLSKLIRIPSPSGEETTLLRFIETYLNRRGLSVERQIVTKNRYNIFVRGGDPKQPSVLLNTHVADDGSAVHTAADSIPRRARGDIIYGRGSCDAKGSVAAMLLAFVAVRQLSRGKHVPVDVCLNCQRDENSGDGM